MQTYTCKKGCCKILINIVKHNHSFNYRQKQNKRKAGVFIYDPAENRILLVQSKGNLWGSPKGTLELNETEVEGAIREVKEETGLVVNPYYFTRYTKIKGRSIYYYLEKKTCDVEVQNCKSQDANGITWIKLECLMDCVKNGNITLSQHCRMVFLNFLGIEFPSDDFVRITKK